MCVWTTASDHEPMHIVVQDTDGQHELKRDKIPARMRRNPRIISKAQETWRRKLP